MAGRKRQASDGGPSAPIWLVSFSDCMTNLLTFFVLLVTFSSYGDDAKQNIRALGEVMRRSFPGFGESSTMDNSAVIPTYQIWATEETAYGSEKPSLTTTPNATEGVLKALLEAPAYKNCMVLQIPSRKVLLGKSVAISPEGRHIMGLLASFLKDVPGRIVVSEHGPDGDTEMGLSRAWAVVEALRTQQDTGIDRYSVSTAGALTAGQLAENNLLSEQQQDERMLEITLAGRSVQD